MSSNIPIPTCWCAKRLAMMPVEIVGPATILAGDPRRPSILQMYRKGEARDVWATGSRDGLRDKREAFVHDYPRPPPRRRMGAHERAAQRAGHFWARKLLTEAQWKEVGDKGLGLYLPAGARPPARQGLILVDNQV